MPSDRPFPPIVTLSKSGMKTMSIAIIDRGAQLKDAKVEAAIFLFVSKKGLVENISKDEVKPDSNAKTKGYPTKPSSVI